MVLVALGVWGYVATGSAHPTALIPCYFGLVLGLCGYLANHEDMQRRKLWMHVAVSIGALGFLGTLKSLWDGFKMLGGTVYEHPVAVEEKAGMSVVCLVFVALCVASFISARRGRGIEA